MMTCFSRINVSAQLIMLRQINQKIAAYEQTFRKDKIITYYVFKRVY